MKPVLIALLCLPAPIIAQPADEEMLIRGILADLQRRSISENVEYCGYVGFDAAGTLIASPPTRGDEGSCLSDDPRKITVITASYHTHGAFTPDYFNEVPSGDDMEGDEDEGIDGWVATPGGRLWYIDTTDMVTFQVCGLRCLPQDPNFVAGDMGATAESYTYDDLVILLDQ